MHLYVCSVFDSAAQAYNRPIFVPSPALALRSFGDEVKRIAPDNAMNAHPDDFELYLLGEFDDSNGQFISPQAPTLLARAKDLITQE